MRILLLLSALAFPPREPVTLTLDANMAARVSVRADSDSVLFVAIMTDLTAAVAEVARRNGYDQSAGPAGWLEPAYLASASTRPDVPEFFKNQAAYTADIEAHMDSIAMGIVDRRLRAAGLDVMGKDGMREAFLRGYHRSDARQKLILGAMRRQSTIALRLHEFLVKVDARVAVNPKNPEALVFQKPVEHRRFDELVMAIDAANEQIAELTTQTTASTQP